MARIRTIKPEFWDSPDTARASHTARLFYIALWNWADDYGKGTASPKQLIGFAFPNDDNITVADYPRLASEAQSAWKVMFYEVDGRPYYYIPTFLKHQRTEKRAVSRIPDPPEGVSAGQSNNHGPSDDSDGPSAPIEGRTVPGTGEQGNRGTGERYTPPPSAGSAQTLLAEWIDHCTDPPPGRVKGQIAREVKIMLDEGIPYERVRQGLAAWQDRKLHPSTLASVVHEIANGGPGRVNGKQQETDQMFDAAMARAIARDQQELLP